MSEKIAVILDTDIGSDIDDAVALAYLLRQPRCELVGITTVSGDVQQRAALAEIVCQTGGQPNVPIHCGRREPLFDGPGQPMVPQYEVARHLPHRLDRPENTAVEFIRQTVRDRPGEITLLSVGPYANLALLFALDPEIPFLLKGLVSMGGVFLSPGDREWNSLCDPTAAAMVYHAKRRHHVSVGLDVTLKCRMTQREVRSRFVMEPLRTVASLATKWFEHVDEITFHDPLAAASLFRPDLLAYRQGTVSANPLTGETHLVEGSGSDWVATAVDVPRFFDEFFSVFTP